MKCNAIEPAKNDNNLIYSFPFLRSHVVLRLRPVRRLVSPYRIGVCPPLFFWEVK